MTSLEQRIQRIEDELAIGQLRARYCHLLDDRNWPAFIDLFTEDGVFQGLDAVRGHAALMDFFSRRVPELTEDFWHFCTNGTVEIEGDAAKGRITLEYLSVTDGVSYVSAGHYDDVMVRRDGRWRFQSRVITFYYLAPLSQGWAGRPFPGR
ncbi:nuclear transport factor 2 family protein [Pseudoroseomonas wenyumeiae]|uniref:Nuclear transport factor 2 family protein n=1 Tax=Teichococcus wenyumeiae TaxID=2478470 RepID=A0A3A9JL14_9PROT|nr:nuclear transport factor 2 family protein [Pseudoroseomonas wenyumeiae]RKK05245.1 nuclear transport factor 2 family protein [Pseudoroseomonas wenyumeiae]RMI19885.1 nuclear transport factor 2 family protein [Pseudoroseomonas wenyumeiae]